MSWSSNIIFFGIGYYLGSNSSIKGHKFIDINRSGITIGDFKLLQNSYDKIKILDVIEIKKL